MKKVLFITILAFLCFSHSALQSQKSSLTVTRVVDGDTIIINGDIRIRLLGVDTPELHHPQKPVQCFAQEAKRFTEDKILNQPVKLTYEGQKQDRYGRILAWVWYGKGFKQLLNAEIIKQGYGFSYRKYPTSKLDKFNELEKQAQEQQKGLWNPNACNGQR